MPMRDMLKTQLSHGRRLGVLDDFRRSARRHDVRLDVLLAIASRETAFGLTPFLADDWSGDGGHGRGLMQIDDRYHSEFTSSHANDDHSANIDYAAQYLRGLLDYYDGDYRRAVPAYNAGQGNVNNAVLAGLSPDYHTTGGDYGSDVLERADVIKKLMPLYGLDSRFSLVSRLVPQPLRDLLGDRALLGWFAASSVALFVALGFKA